MADDDFLMGDDLFGSDFEDLISKDDLITSEGLNYFLGVDDQVNAMIPPGGVSDTESINSLTSQGLMNGSFNDMIRREKTRKKKKKKKRDGNMWENTIDMASFDFDNNSDNFMFSDPSNRSDSEMSSNSLLFATATSTVDKNRRKSTSKIRRESSGNKASSSSNRKLKSSPKTNNGKKPSVNNSKSFSRSKGGDKGHSRSNNKYNNSNDTSSLSSSNNVKEEKVDTEEKRRRRLERNRESARQSRRRKKQYMELLEEKVEQLSNELNMLRLEQLSKSARVLRVQRTDALKVVNTMRSLQDVQSDDPILKERVDEIINAFGCNTEERRAVLEYYFRMLNGTILPPYTRFLIWMVNQGEEFFSDVGPSHRARNKLTQQKVVASTLTGEMRMEEIVPNTGDNATDVITQAAKKAVQRISSTDNLTKLEANNNNINNKTNSKGGTNANGAGQALSSKAGNSPGSGTIWPLVSNELGLTYEQEEKMKAVFVAQDTAENRRERKNLHVVNTFLSKLGEASILRAKAVHDLTSKMHQVLTPVQSARFLLWMEKNRNRVHECGLDHLLASGNLAPDHPKALIAQNVASQFVNKSAKELYVNEMISLLKQIAASNSDGS